MSIHEALSRLIIEFDEVRDTDGAVRARGLMRFGAALEGPPGRLHGGHHAFVRTLPIVERISAHERTRTFPCEIDVSLQQGLLLEKEISFEARYRSDGGSWEIDTRFEGTDRLSAHARSIANRPLLDASALDHWRALYQASLPGDSSFEMFGFTIHLSRDVAWLECRDPARTLPGSQHAALLEPDGSLGPAFVTTQLDTIGATARGALMRHPHFTTHIEIQLGTRKIPGETHLVCIADRTRIEEIEESTSAPVELEGRAYGTARSPVVLVDASFERAFATGWVTVHPVDPAKFEALRKMRQIRKDL